MWSGIDIFIPRVWHKALRFQNLSFAPCRASRPILPTVHWLYGAFRYKWAHMIKNWHKSERDVPRNLYAAPLELESNALIFMLKVFSGNRIDSLFWQHHFSRKWVYSFWGQHFWIGAESGRISLHVTWKLNRGALKISQIPTGVRKKWAEHKSTSPQQSVIWQHLHLQGLKA